MGSKIHPNIFRLGKTNSWKSKYYEKKSIESSVYLNKDLEIRKFIFKFFKSNGLTINNSKLFYFNSSLYIFISYIQNINSISLLNDINKSQNIKTIKKPGFKRKKKFRRTYSTFKKNLKNYISYGEIDFLKSISNYVKMKKKIKRAKKIIKQEKNSLKIRRVKMLKYYKQYLSIKDSNSIKNIKNNSFLEKFFESLTLFAGEKTNFYLIFKPLNKNVKQKIAEKKLRLLKKKLVQLRRYKQNEFFKEGVNLLFLCATHKNSAHLLAQFLAEQLSGLKRHNFFLKFVKNVLTLFLNKTLSDFKGIKIKIKGRLNGTPRAKSKILKIGNNMPILTLNSNIDYSETTSYSKNGTLGVKVWTCEN